MSHYMTKCCKFTSFLLNITGIIQKSIIKGFLKCKDDVVRSGKPRQHHCDFLRISFDLMYFHSCLGSKNSSIQEVAIGIEGK